MCPFSFWAGSFKWEVQIWIPLPYTERGLFCFSPGFDSCWQIPSPLVSYLRWSIPILLHRWSTIFLALGFMPRDSFSVMLTMKSATPSVKANLFVFEFPLDSVSYKCSPLAVSLICCCSVPKSCTALWDPMDFSVPLPCPLLSPTVCSSSCPLRWRCCLNISTSFKCF